MRVTLIRPASSPRRVKPFWLPPLSLAIVAAWTPDGYDVTIVDESVEEIDFDDVPDVVGITTLTAWAPRSYAIANEFRRRGARVIIGGLHASARPQEALAHADVVVVGPAETAWPEALAVAVASGPPRIVGGEFRALFTPRPPRRDLYRQGAYLSSATAQCSVGCPYRCPFCSVAGMFDGWQHTHPVAAVLADIDSLGNDYIFLVDDNILTNRPFARVLLDELRKRKLRWWGQTSLSTLRNPAIVADVAASGCLLLIVGVESVSPASVNSLDKIRRLADRERIIRTVQESGVMINPSFVFGLDTDGPESFDATLAFLDRVRTPLATFNIQTPYPGTRLYADLEQAGRITDHDYSRYDGGHVVYQPLQMTAAALQAGYDRVVAEFYSPRRIAARTSTLPRGTAGLMYQWNSGYRRMLDAFGVILG